MKWILATGGTGGHIIPAIQVALEIKARGGEAVFIGRVGRFEEEIRQQGFQVEAIPCRGFYKKGPLEFLCFIFDNLKGLWKSFCYIRKYRARGVLGFGGYASFPVVLAALILRRPTAIHEQNVIPGKANAILSKYVSKVFISFSQTETFLKRPNVVMTGCPCQITGGIYSREVLLNEFGLQENKDTLLVFGGSRGSRRLNETVIKSVQLLMDKKKYQIIHISGEEDYNYLKGQYERSEITFALFSFLKEMGKAYRLADLVIARAGALTVTEIGTLKIPAILIPYPYAEGHQKANAALLSEGGLAEVILEKDLSPEILAGHIQDRLKTNPEIVAAGECFDKMNSTHPAQVIVGQLAELMSLKSQD